MQVLSTAPSPRLSPQVQMGDTRRQIEMMYAEGHKQKASLLAQQQEALKVQREQQRKEIADEEAALAELQRKLHATRTRHQNDARTLHQSHVVAITTMAAELEKEASTLWEGLRGHQRYSVAHQR
jgi:predicted  nucleic acid-binding Zn-ribbon protein